MIPQKELDQLIQYYKGELTENALLNKTATLASKKHLLLADPNYLRLWSMPKPNR